MCEIYSVFLITQDYKKIKTFCILKPRNLKVILNSVMTLSPVDLQAL